VEPAEHPLFRFVLTVEDWFGSYAVTRSEPGFKIPVILKLAVEHRD
jgi:hypothetical protein